MRIERLRLSNFRGFEELDLEFPKHGTTVLVGNNGAGKTSILEAIGVLLQQFASTQDWSGRIGERLTYGDVNLGATECHLELTATIGDVKDGSYLSTWQAVFPDTDGEASARVLARVAPASHKTSAPPAFFLLNFSVERVFHGELSRWLSSDTDGEIERPASPTSIEYSEFVRWFFDRENLENEQIREQPSFRDPELSAVRLAIERLCEGFSNLRIRRARISTRSSHMASSTKFVVDKVVNGRKELFEVDQLSHGERGLLAMVGLIACQLSDIDADHPSPLDGPGVVLIDEIELHLHPGWQRDIIPRLERTFPNIQFIVTTHSPQVLSQLHPENVKILENFRLVERTPPTYGRDSNAILEDVMGVPERPAFATAKLTEIATLIDEEKWHDARARLHTLTRDLGTLDAEVVRLRTMIDMLDDARDAAK